MNSLTNLKLVTRFVVNCLKFLFLAVLTVVLFHQGQSIFAYAYFDGQECNETAHYEFNACDINFEVFNLDNAPHGNSKEPHFTINLNSHSYYSCNHFDFWCANCMADASFESVLNIRYIPNARYFMINPRHVPSNYFDNEYVASCTTAAVQMIFSYHAFFTDRRLVPSEFFYSEFATMRHYPLFDRGPVMSAIILNVDPVKVSIGCIRLGTHDSFKDELLYQTTNAFGVPASSPLGQTIFNVSGGARRFVDKRASDISHNVTITPGVFWASIARGEIDAGRPVIIGYTLLGNTPSAHVMVAYGYATINGIRGFIVNYKEELPHKWVPETAFGWMIIINVASTQYFASTGEVVNINYQVLRCNAHK